MYINIVIFKIYILILYVFIYLTINLMNGTTLKYLYRNWTQPLFSISVLAPGKKNKLPIYAYLHNIFVYLIYVYYTYIVYRCICVYIYIQ